MADCPNPTCSRSDAYVGACTVECANPECMHYSERVCRQADSETAGDGRSIDPGMGWYAFFTTWGGPL